MKVNDTYLNPYSVTHIEYDELNDSDYQHQLTYFIGNAPVVSQVYATEKAARDAAELFVEHYLSQAIRSIGIKA